MIQQTRGAPVEEKLLTNCFIDPESGCWRWLGADARGYGVVWIGDERWRVHRLAYTLWVGPIPTGFVVDHVKARGCIYKDCFNPDHLEAVTQAENLDRGSTVPALNVRKACCPQGHEYTPENTYVTPKGWRKCRTCTRIGHARRRQEVMGR